MSATEPRVIVVGAGFSGTLFAIQFVRQSPGSAVPVLLLERSEKQHRGVAYGTESPLHLLNVPAGNMSALPDDPTHFLEWLRTRMPEAEASTFAPRKLFGDYLEELFALTQRDHPGRLKVLSAEAVEVNPTPNGALVVLSNGETLHADIVVLALGNYPPAHPSFVTEYVVQSGHYIGDPWRPGCLDPIEPEDSVLVIGTGLTMVDKVIELSAKGHVGPITAVSRRGLLPLGHDLSAPKVKLDLDLTPGLQIRTLTALLRSIISQVGKQTPGADWRSVVDALRPHTPRLWQAMPLREKRRFLHHVRPFWEVVRHRIPPVPMKTIERLVAAGQLKTMAASITRIVPRERGAWVWARTGDHGHTQPIDVDWIINCSGSGPDFARRNDPLTVHLFSTGQAVPGDVGLGLHATEVGEVINRSGRPQGYLLTFGPPLKGLLWESTAVPELRVQAERVARHAVALLRASGRL